MPHTTIIVPCFNEEHRIPVDAFDEFVRSHDWVQFLMVDDGSNDGTANVLKRMHDRHPQSIRFANLESNMGKAEAVRQGICTALAESPQFIGYWDADLAAPLNILEQFRDILERFPQIEIVLGSRLPLLGHAVDRTLVRRCTGRLFAWAAAAVLGLSVYDTQAGHKVFRVTNRLRDVFARPFRTRWLFDVELLARWIDRPTSEGNLQIRDSIYELPLEHWRDVTGSKLRSWDFFRAFWELATIASDRQRTNFRNA